VIDSAKTQSLDGWCDGAQHHYPLRVQYEDTDAGGIVYHAQYLAFAERARSAWLRYLHIDQPQLLKDRHIGFVVRRIAIDFEQAAGLGDVVDVTSEMVKIGGASMKLQQTITNVQFRHIVARLIVDIGVVNLHIAGQARACRMPEDIKDKLAHAQASPPITAA